jgi:hypothetical protein
LGVTEQHGRAGSILCGRIAKGNIQFARLGSIVKGNHELFFFGLAQGRGHDIGVFGSTFGHSVTQNLPVLLVQNLVASSDFESAFNLAEGPPRPGLEGSGARWRR